MLGPQRSVMMLLAAMWLAVCGPAAADDAKPPEKNNRPKRLLLLGQSPDSHPKSTHEYLPGVRMVAALLKDTPGLETQVINADEPWPQGPELLKQADGAVIFLSQGAKWLSDDPRRKAAFADLASRGGGISALHWGMGTQDAKNIAAFLRLVGGCHGGPDRKYKVVEATCQVADNPIMQGIDDFRVREEFYYRLKFVKANPQVRPALKVSIDGKLETVAWTWRRPDGGRSFGFSGLHFHDNWRLPEYQRMVAQGILWTMKLPSPGSDLNLVVDEDLLKVR